MAHDSNGFKLITVNQDEDDIVIQAGIRDDVSAGYGAGADDASEDDSWELEYAEDGDELVEELSDSVYEEQPGDDEREEDDERVVEQPRQAPSKRNKWDGYVTTAEDLKGTPMPFAQKATIIGGLALLAFAIGYYFLFM